MATTTNKTADPASKDLDSEAIKSKKSRWFGKGSTQDVRADEKPKDKVIGDGEKDGESDLGPNTCTGTVRIGSTKLHEVDLKWWRSQIGLVQQEPFLFNDTLYNNVAFGLCGTRYADLPKEEKLKMVERSMP